MNEAKAQATGIRPEWRQSEQNAANARLANGGKSKVRIRFPYEVKQVSPHEVEVEVIGTTEDPLTDDCYARLRELLGEREAMRIERKSAALILREQIIALMEIA